MIGLSSAWRLAQRGASVIVVDAGMAGAASGVAAGMLAPVTEARLGEEPLLALNRASWARWPAFAAEVAEAAGRPSATGPTARWWWRSTPTTGPRSTSWPTATGSWAWR